MPGIGVVGGPGELTGVDVVKELTKGMERESGLSRDNTLKGETEGDEQVGSSRKGERVHTSFELGYKKSSGGGDGGEASSGAVKIRSVNVENGGGGGEGGGGAATVMEKEQRDPRGLSDTGRINHSHITTISGISDAALSKLNVVDEWGKDVDAELLNDEDSR